MIPVCRRVMRPRFYEVAKSPAVVAVWATNEKIVIGVYPQHHFFDWSATRIVQTNNFQDGLDLADRLEKAAISAQRRPEA